MREYFKTRYHRSRKTRDEEDDFGDLEPGKVEPRRVSMGGRMVLTWA
jgi:hypothetical protein